MKLDEIINNKTPCKYILSEKNSNSKFTFDLNAMRRAVNAKVSKLPSNIQTFEEFDEWMHRV